MWQRFTEPARRVILFAQEEAGTAHSEDVGTEYLLLGLTREKEGVAARVLQHFGVTEEKVGASLRATLMARFIERVPNQSRIEPKLTPASKRVLELSAAESRRLNLDFIGPEHLLLALLRNEDAVLTALFAQEHALTPSCCRI